MRKDLVCKYQLWVDRRIQYGEDAVCVYSCLIAANKVAVVNKAYYHHRLREGSICSSTDERYFERITALYQQLKAQFERHPSSVCLMEQMNRYMLDLVVRGINKMFGTFKTLCSLLLYGNFFSLTCTNEEDFTSGSDSVWMGTDCMY